VALLVPLTVTVALATGSFLESVTVPLTFLVCAILPSAISNAKNEDRKPLSFLLIHVWFWSGTWASYLILNNAYTCVNIGL
jgi:hypothetical protein